MRGNGDNVRRTQRGFAIYTEFKNRYGFKDEIISVQESSSAMRRKVWIFSRAEGKTEAIHLDVSGAKMVIKALQKFVDGVD